jgi:hypothetical protein
MKKILLLALLSFLIMLPIKLTAQDMATKKSVCGSWLGKLNGGGMDLRVIFNLKLSEKDSLTVTLDSPDQGAEGIPAGPVILDNQKIVIQAPGINGEYNGIIKGDSLIGTWTQNGGSAPLNLKKQSPPPEVSPK